jgi:DNA-binding phage protein
MEEDLFQKENALKEERMINAELRSKLQQAEAKLLQVSMDVQQPTRDLETVAKKVAGISTELLHAMAKFRSLEF